MGIFSSDVESIEIKFDQVQIFLFCKFKCQMLKDGKPFLAGDEVTGTITATFKKDVKVKNQTKCLFKVTFQTRSILFGFLHLSQQQLDLTSELQKEMSRDIQRCLKNTTSRKKKSLSMNKRYQLEKKLGTFRLHLTRI